MRFSLCFVLLSQLAVTGCSNEDATDDADDATSAQDRVAAHVDVMMRRIDANNRQDWSAWTALHTADVVRTAPELDAPLVGASQLRAGIEQLVTTFPDYHLELVDAFGEGDRLIARIHTHATMLGPLQIGETTLPPTGLSFDQDWVALVSFDGDLIKTIDEFHDNYTLLIQLGLGSAP